TPSTPLSGSRNSGSATQQVSSGRYTASPGSHSISPSVSSVIPAISRGRTRQPDASDSLQPPEASDGLPVTLPASLRGSPYDRHRRDRGPPIKRRRASSRSSREPGEPRGPPVRAWRQPGARREAVRANSNPPSTLSPDFANFPSVQSCARTGARPDT